MKEREVKTAQIRFGTLFEVNPEVNNNIPNRIDMVKIPTSEDYFYTIQTMNDKNGKLILIPGGSGTTHPRHIGSILPERIGLVEALIAYKRGLLYESSNRITRLPKRIIFEFWRYSECLLSRYNMLRFRRKDIHLNYNKL